jgi:hypothetical protein
MMGRALLIGTLFIGLGLAGITRRVDAQSDIEQDDVSTGEISEETSSPDLGTDDISSDDQLSDDSFSTDKGNKEIAPPPKALRLKQ